MPLLIKELKNRPQQFETIVCVTGQHREMLDKVLSLFEITPDYYLRAIPLTDIPYPEAANRTG